VTAGEICAAGAKSVVDDCLAVESGQPQLERTYVGRARSSGNQRSSVQCVDQNSARLGYMYQLARTIIARTASTGL